jgi:hypothetical protein
MPPRRAGGGRRRGDARLLGDRLFLLDDESRQIGREDASLAGAAKLLVGALRRETQLAKTPHRLREGRAAHQLDFIAVRVIFHLAQQEAADRVTDLHQGFQHQT